MQNEDELKEAFGYELSTYPSSLYKENGFVRPADGKYAFADHLLKQFGVTIENADLHPAPEAGVLVMDGAMLYNPTRSRSW